MSLVEVLVSIVILGISTLCIAALQVAGKRNNLDAAQRTLAAQAAHDILERMRTHGPHQGLRALVAQASPWTGRGRLASDYGNAACTARTPCNGAALALHDLRLWERTLDGYAEQVDGIPAGGLKLPTACLQGPADGGSGLYTVTISWRGSIPLPDNAAVACGRGASGAGRFAPRGTRLYGEQDQFRRSVTVQAYILSRAV